MIPSPQARPSFVDARSRCSNAVEWRRGKNINIKEVVEVDPEKMSGVPCFTGSHVPISHLFEYLESGETVDEFLDQLPTVSRAQVSGVLELSMERLLNSEACLMSALYVMETS